MPSIWEPIIRLVWFGQFPADICLLWIPVVWKETVADISVMLQVLYCPLNTLSFCRPSSMLTNYFTGKISEAWEALKTTVIPLVSLLLKAANLCRFGILCSYSRYSVSLLFLRMFIYFGVCACLCTCVCACMCMYTHVHEHVPVEARRGR